LVAKHPHQYWHVFAQTTLLGLLAFGGVTGFFHGYVIQRLALHWRSWMTQYLLRRYLTSLTYFRIEQDNDVDNVDQRIQQETAPFCSMVTYMPNIIVGAVAHVSVQGWILLAISPTLFYGVLVYGALTAALTWILYAPFIRLNFQSTAAEADLRYGLLHIRTNAETVALYGGEYAEEASVNTRLERAIRIALSTMRYQFVMSTTESGFGIIWTLLPVLVLVPSYFSGHISFGVIAQGTASAAMLLQGIRRFTQFIPIFSSAAPHVVRLAQITEKTQAIQAELSDPASTITREVGTQVAFKDMTLCTPGGERTLVTKLNLLVRESENVLIMGRTGVGKSSLLRALSGIWRRGTGTVTMPRHSALFLPQRQYMLLGTLRQQILYPDIDRVVSDAQLGEWLTAVNLANLAHLHGGFDTVLDWSRILSLGEQQRIGFARVLASEVKTVFLDEATSAVDIATERLLYTALGNAGVTAVSVGHRTTLMEYHSVVLELLGQGEWQVRMRDRARAASA